MRAGREVKSFGPEAIVPNQERDDCMEEVLEEVAQVGVLTVENLNRMNDAFAKFIFANEARKLLTLDLVNSFFEFEGTAQITDFKFIDREQDPDRKWGKGVVLDVVGESSDGTLVNVEIQLQQFDDMDRRTLYYWAQLYTRRLLSGEDYDNLNMEDANIHTAMEAEKEFVKNPICITAYEQHQKYLRDKHAREKYLRKEGEAKAERDMIKTLHASGMSAEEIAARLQKDIAVVRQILQ